MKPSTQRLAPFTTTALRWLYAVAIAFLWSIAAVTISAIAACLIDMDGMSPDLEVFAWTFAPWVFVLPVVAYAVHRSKRIAALIIPSLALTWLVFTFFFITLFMMSMGG